MFKYLRKNIINIFVQLKRPKNNFSGLILFSVLSFILPNYTAKTNVPM